MVVDDFLDEFAAGAFEVADGEDLGVLLGKEVPHYTGAPGSDADAADGDSLARGEVAGVTEGGG